MPQKIRIALAADTILYLPVYLLERDGLAAAKNIEVKLVPEGGETKGGDQVAFDMVREGTADLCICDPMVTVPKARQDNGGVVVASMVSRYGLWGITTPFISFNFSSWKGDLLEHVTSVPERSLRSILTYSSASSGRKAVDYVRNQKENEAEFRNTHILHADFGTELSYLTKPFKLSGNDIPIDLIVTCDLVGVLAAEARREQILAEARANTVLGSQAKYPPKIGVEFHDRNGFGQCLFTALVTTKEFLAREPRLVGLIVREIQSKLEQFYALNETGLRTLARFLCEQPSLFPSVGPHESAFIKCSTESREDFCKEALSYLKSNKILAQSVKIEKYSWESASVIWGLNSGSKVGRDPYYFKLCTDNRLASQAHPGQFKRRAQDTWRNHKHLLVSIGSSYGLIGATLGVLGITVGNLITGALFGALVVGGGILGWLVSDWISGGASQE